MPLKRIGVEGGDVLHVLKSTDRQYNCFNEAYFSIIKSGSIKAWKKHQRMTLNIVVPIGNVQFIFYEDQKLILNTIIGEDNYCLLTIRPGIWFGFKGLSESDSYILNIADIIHDGNEVERQPLNFLKFLPVQK